MKNTPNTPDEPRAVIRPGSGGRQKNISAFTPTSATEELYRAHGEPRIEHHSGAVMMTWLVDESGDGLIQARLSSRDLQGGETAMGQVHPLVSLVEQLGRKPRMIVVTVNNTGARHFEDRPDFQLAKQEIAAGNVRWVAWREPDRIAREETPFFVYRDLLRDTGTELILGNLGRVVDFHNDRYQLNMQNTAAADERIRIYNRTHGALHSQWVAMGRGWPSSGGIGFRRNPETKFLEVDPEQWPFIRMIFQLYLEPGASLKTVSEAVSAAGFPISTPKVNDILNSLMYVTGEYTISRRGQLIACEPVDLGKHAIPMDVYQRAQDLRKIRKGKATRSPEGTFPLNGLLVHECGCDLIAREERGSRSAYRHRTSTPGDCKGVSFDSDVLDATVCRELLRLASCGELQRAWTARAEHEAVGDSPLLSEDEKKELQARASRIEQAIESRARSFNERLINGEDVDEQDLKRLVGNLESELAEVRQRLRQAEALSSVRRTAAAARRHTESLLTELEYLLSEELPDDHTHRARRAALIRKMVSRVTVFGTQDVEIELEGPLVPTDLPRAPMHNPLDDVADLKAEEESEASRADVGSSTQTDSQGVPYQTVRAAGTPPIKRPLTQRSKRRSGRDRPVWRSPRVTVRRARRPPVTALETKTLRRLVSLAVTDADLTYGRLAAIATEEGLPTARRGRWHGTSCREALRQALLQLDLDAATADAVRAFMRKRFKPSRRWS